MNVSYDDILDALLKECENNPQADVNTLAQEVVKKMNLKFDSKPLEQTNELIDSFNDSYNDLIEEKEKSGVSTEVWTRKKLVAIASESGLDEKGQAEVVEVVAEAIEANNTEIVENLE